MFDAHKAREGCEKIAERFKVPIPSVAHVIMAEMKFTGTVEVRIKDKGEDGMAEVHQEQTNLMHFGNKS